MASGGGTLCMHQAARPPREHSMTIKYCVCWLRWAKVFRELFLGDASVQHANVGTHEDEYARPCLLGDECLHCDELFCMSVARTSFMRKRIL